MVYSIQDLLLQWESRGVFEFVLPFLLIFAIVYGILSYMKIFGDNRQVNVIIALVIGILSLRIGLLQAYITELFPRLGVGLAIILAVMLLVGMFIAKDEKRYWFWGLGALGAVIALIVITNSFSELGLIDYYGSSEMVGWIIGAVLLLGVIIAVAASGSDRKKDRVEAIFDGLFGRNGRRE